MKTIMVIGGAGDMATVASRWLLDLRRGLQVVLADLDAAKAAKRAARLGGGTTSAAVDVFDGARLRELVRGADLVINATGPLYRTVSPVLEACIDERVDYIDFGDTVEAADIALAMDRPARDAGVTAIIGAGVAPGLANIAARQMADRLDTPLSIQLAWVTGASPIRPGAEHGGRSLIEHMVHSCAGITVTVEGGRRTELPAYRRSEVLAFPLPLGPVRVYDIGHAELATIPRFLPTVRRVRTQGSVQPAALNGVFQGLGAAVAAGKLPWEDAVEFGMALQEGRMRGRGLRAALSGVCHQVLRRELGLGGLIAAARTARGSGTTGGGLYVRVDGLSDGRPAGWLGRAAVVQTAEGEAMDDVTGAPLAIVAHLMLDGQVQRPGVVATEAAVAPALVVPLLDRVGLAATKPLFAPEAVDSARP